MADPNGSFYNVIDAKTGDPTTVPIEAVNNEYKKGNIKFLPGTRVPVKKGDQELTVPAEQYDAALQDGAEPNFDPGGIAKTAIAGLARLQTLGVSDYIAQGAAWLGAGLRGEDQDKAVEDAKKTLEGLRADHSVTDTAASVGGIFLPTGVEGLAGKLLEGGAGVATGVDEAAHMGRVAGDITDAGSVVTKATEATAAMGKTQGSALGRMIRLANPYEAVGRVADVVTSPLGRMFGENIGTVAKYGVEGALISAANEYNEDELGNIPFTGEALYSSVAEGGVFGGALGLVGIGAKRVLTTAGKLADRLAESNLGGSSKEYRNAMDRWGRGGLGAAYNEMGIGPFATAEEKYQIVGEVAKQRADTLEKVVTDADGTYKGASVQELRAEVQRAIANSQDSMIVLGDSGKTLGDKILKDFDEHFKWQHEPPRPEPIPEGTADTLYNERVKQMGLAEEGSVKPPREVREVDTARRWRDMAENEGLGTRTEEPRAKFSKEEIANYRRSIEAKLTDPNTSIAEKRAAGVMLLNPDEMKRNAATEINKAVETRNARRLELRQLAHDSLHEEYATKREMYERFLERHAKLRGESAKQVSDMKAEQDREYGRLRQNARTLNSSNRAQLSAIREFRKPLDKLIPWGRSKDAVTNAAVEVKHKIRGALEGHVERQFDRLTRNNPDSGILGRYLHAKARYGQAKDILKQLDRERGAEAKRFGRLNRYGMGGHLMSTAIGAAMGHPGIGLSVGLGASIGRHYGPPVAAWALHKATRLTELKALKEELEIVTNRSAKSLLTPNSETTAFSRVKVPDFPPHKLRMTAADAMAEVYKLADNHELIGRLAALNADHVVLAPKVVEAQEGAARRAIMFLMSRIPGNIMRTLQAGGKPTSTDLSDSQAQSFMREAASIADPRYTLDQASKGQLTQGIVTGYKTAFPQNAAFLAATLKRIGTQNKQDAMLISTNRKSAVNMLVGDDDRGLTMALQQNAKAMNAQMNQGPAPGAGMSHASFKDKGAGQMANSLSTQSQTVESGPPGRRGGRGSSLGI